MSEALEKIKAGEENQTDVNSNFDATDTHIYIHLLIFVCLQN